MENITILEAARLLGYTKNAVKYQVKKLPEEMTQKDANGIIHITPEGLETLRDKMGNKQPVKEPEKNQQTSGKEPDKEPGENALYSALLQTVETLRGQLEEKDKQLNAATEEKARLLQLLDQQQRLNAGQLASTKTEALPEAKEEPERGGIFGLFRRGKQ